MGNAYSFLLTWLLVKSRDGRILLRIDDMDAARKRPQYVADIFQTLEWLQITCDEGPLNPDDFEARFSQIHRMQLYLDLLKNLQDTGLVFACRCTRTSTTSTHPLPHRCQCRSAGFSLEGPVAWRLFVPPETTVMLEGRAYALGEREGNFVIRRRDGLPAYQVTSVADDLFFGINTIVRGADLLASSAMQSYLMQILGREPFVFFHHPLIEDSSGQKLSKSAKSPALLEYRSAGSLDDFLSGFCRWAGIRPQSSIADIAGAMRQDLKNT